MSKFNRKIVFIVCISVFLLSGCTNKNTDKGLLANKNTDKELQVNKDKEIVTEKGNEIINNENTFKDDESIIEDETKGKDEDKIISNKQKYLDEMDILDENLNMKLKGKLEGTNLEMIEAESEMYEAWDEILNKVYSEIINKLSQEEKDKLILEENNWIKERDKKADAAAKEVEGGSMEPLAKITSLVVSTKERCYELVNNYMK